jgi:hypothetical protein
MVGRDLAHLGIPRPSSAANNGFDGVSLASGRCECLARGAFMSRLIFYRGWRVSTTSQVQYPASSTLCLVVSAGYLFHTIPSSCSKPRSVGHHGKVTSPIRMRLTRPIMALLYRVSTVYKYWVCLQRPRFERTHRHWGVRCTSQWSGDRVCGLIR